MTTPEIVIEYDQQENQQEDGVEIPMERINAETLRNLISEFVTREWEEIGDASHSLDDKIEQVYRQLQDKKARVVFDLTSNSANIVVSR
jgi:uncharacterized protein YheU (UPF0270 family)